jgi:hypothetical protein
LLPPAALKQLSAFLHQTYLQIDEPMWAIGIVDTMLECEKLLEEETSANDLAALRQPTSFGQQLTREGGLLQQLTWKHKLFLLIFGGTLLAIGMIAFWVCWSNSSLIFCCSVLLCV